MTVVVTAASGHLGRLSVEALLSRGVPADQIVAGARDPEKIADLAARGVRTARIDYDDPESLKTALDGATRVLLVSGTAVGTRVGQHTAVAEAALAAGAELLVYTSAPYADTTSMKLADDHRDSERAIRSVGVPFSFLRNSWYLENYTGQLPTYLEHGVLGSAGDGRISAASRQDYAEAAAAVLTTDGHANTVYELGGDTAFTLTELAAVVAEASGKPVAYQDVPQTELQKILGSVGVPAPMDEILADVDRAIRDDNALLVTSGDLGRLIGHPTASLTDAVRTALA